MKHTVQIRKVASKVGAVAFGVIDLARIVANFDEAILNHPVHAVRVIDNLHVSFQSPGIGFGKDSELNCVCVCVICLD